jgi:single-stranded DNA-binding protein
MSLHLLAAGSIIGDPQRREGAKGPFTTATVRIDADEAVLVSIIAFVAESDQLLAFVKGDAIAVSGRARLTSWTGRDGIEKHGISVIAEQIAAAKPRPRAAGASTRPRSPTQSSYSAPRAPGRVADLPADRVDDLWGPSS